MTKVKTDEVLPLRAILNKAKHYPNNVPVLYFLIDNKIVVYVGQASCIARAWMRMYSHVLSTKQFDSFAWFEIEGDPDIAEAEHILHFTPKYNAQLPIQERWKPLSTIARLAGITPGCFRKMLMKKGVYARHHFGSMFYKVADVTRAEIGGES